MCSVTPNAQDQGKASGTNAKQKIGIK